MEKLYKQMVSILSEIYELDITGKIELPKELSAKVLHVGMTAVEIEQYENEIRADDELRNVHPWGEEYS